MPRSFRHWTPRYVWDRARVMLDERLRPGRPWLTAHAVDLLDELLRPEDAGLEFGSGRSTLWFARRLGRLTSVEGDPGWYERVRTGLEAAGLGHVTYLRRTPGEDYAAALDGFEDASLDFVLVDGHDRDACAAGALGKLAPGGLLVIDNVNWYLPRAPRSRAPNGRTPEDGCESPLWEEVFARIRHWRQIWTTNGVTDTAIFFRP